MGVVLFIYMMVPLTIINVAPMKLWPQKAETLHRKLLKFK